ncbi:hypothetical protein AB833_19090 [Chromatiales bacterium (ex Bugula neritina AB1)]|nr:hypothetical protein AB833_19090 [Chromatiales bacterium (ex Bugula neritina AB1)]
MSTNSGVGAGASGTLLASLQAGLLPSDATSRSFGATTNPAVNTAMMIAVSSVLQQLTRLRRRGDRQGDTDLYYTRSRRQSHSTHTDADHVGSAFVRNTLARERVKPDTPG